MKYQDEIENLFKFAENNPIEILNLYITTKKRLMEAEAEMKKLIGKDPDDLSGIMSYLMKYQEPTIKHKE